jgi:hypothetical protein
LIAGETAAFSVPVKSIFKGSGLLKKWIAKKVYRYRYSLLILLTLTQREAFTMDAFTD